MLCWSALFSSGSWRQVIQDRISPRTADQVKVIIFLYDGYEVLLYILAVAQNDDILLCMKLRHHIAYHGCGKFQF